MRASLPGPAPLALLLLLPLAACATRPAPPPAAAPGLSPAEIVAARQSAFHLSAATFGGMKPVVDGGGEVKPLGFAARGLVSWARTLPSMFPAGTHLPESRARAEVWSDRAGFDAEAAAYLAAAERLAAAASAGDKPAFAAAWKDAGARCSSCHDRYRAERD